MELIAELTPLHRPQDSQMWRPRVYAMPRPDGTWAAWLQFAPAGGDGAVLTTQIETTQPNRDAVAYWATGLEDVYLEGALARSTSRGAGLEPHDEMKPIASTHVHLQQIDLYVLDFLRRAGGGRVVTQRLFSDQVYANADLVRSFEHLERDHRLLLRVTENGVDWLELTENGAASLEVAMTHDDARP